MKTTRSSKLWIGKHLTAKKKAELVAFMQEYARVGNAFISLYEDSIPNTSLFDITKADTIARLSEQTNTWLTARAIKNVIKDAYGCIVGARNLAAATGKPYASPRMNGKKMTLSETCNTHSDAIATVAFDYNVTLRCFDKTRKGFRISIPVKRHLHFNKWAALGKLAKTITVHRDYIQFTVEIETGKKKTQGRVLGIDLGVKKMIATSDRHAFGLELERLIENLNCKKQYSKAWHRANRTLLEYIDKTVKELPWGELRAIAVEKLAGLKTGLKAKRRLAKNMRRVISKWCYPRVLLRLQSHCELNRVSFRRVSPWRTSQTCSICGYADKRNRLTQENFVCQQCGHTDDADFNAAINILGRLRTGAYDVPVSNLDNQKK